MNVKSSCFWKNLKSHHDGKTLRLSDTLVPLVQQWDDYEGSHSKKYVENILVHTDSKFRIEEKFCLGVFRVLKIRTCNSHVQVCCIPFRFVKYF